MTKAQFERRTHIDVYTRTFTCEPLLVSLKPRIMMLTYSEWWFLATGALLEPDLSLLGL